MQFNISKSALWFSTICRVIASITIPHYRNQIRILSEDELTLTGSDADLSIKKMIPANEESNSLDIKEPGSIVLEARYLLDIVRKMDSDIIHFEIVDGTLVKISGKCGSIQSQWHLGQAAILRLIFRLPKCNSQSRQTN